jgi:two-component system CitB family sensor kinase
MERPLWPRVPFAGQILALQIGVVTLVVGVGFALIGWLLDRELITQYEQRALAVAHAVAADPVIASAAARDDPDGVVQPRAEAVRALTGARFVVVTNRQGLRLSHPNPDLIGKPVSTDPSVALGGQDVVNVERGTLGLSARGKVPLRYRGAIVGEISVGFLAEDIRGEVLHKLSTAALFAGGAALLLGVAGSILLARRLKRLTLGLEPHELAELVREREAVLHGIGEGVLAIDAAGRVSVCNGEATRLLGVEPVPGTPVDDLDLPPRLRAALDGGSPADNVIAVAGERVLVANFRGVHRDGRDLGGVLTMRDRTDLETLTRELDSVRALTKALRAQRHEFANRLHTIAGLLQTNHHDEAVEYLHALSAGSATALGPGADAVKDPYLQAFLAAKTAEADEKGVRLELGETSWMPGRVVAPVEVTTVLGNLVDNAVEAARLGTRRPAWVEVSLVADGETLHMSIVDSGEGVPPELAGEIFIAGVSTHDSDERGLGLALAQHAARGLGGQITLGDAGTGEHGAVFVARLPGALE